MAADPLDIIAAICHEQPHDALTQIAEALGYTEQREQERTQREQTLAGLLKRCARCLPPGHATRVLATDYLRQHGYLSPLRAPGVSAVAPVRLVEGPPRDFGQAQDRYGEHMDRPAGGMGGPDHG